MFYTAKKNDTIGRIAREFDLQAAQIKKLNPYLKEPLFPGQRLFIPVLPEETVNIGDCGEDVLRIQEALEFLGYDLAVDGKYGVKTQEIIRNLQRKMPELKPNGVFNPAARAFLKHLLFSGYRINKNPSDILALINKSNALSHAYEPEDLVVPDIPFKTGGSQIEMRKEAARALEALIRQAFRDGVFLGGVSGYRSYTTQAQIYRDVWKNSPVAELVFHARPGESEHQSGLAVDIGSPGQSYQLEQWFADTLEGKWLAEHAPDFGFIVRYPKDKEDITGYPYEPWHFRYVGSAAREIADANITLEEYLQK